MRMIAAACAVFLVTLIASFTTFSPAFGAQQLSGQDVFRFDTFGDEQLWTDTLRLNEAIETVTPAVALSVGLKVDSNALPPPVLRDLRAGQFDVNDPRNTRRLLEMNAVVGVVANVAGDRVRTLGVTCALCHSTVDNSLAPGIGRRLDGWPNLSLDVGTIVSLSPVLPDALKTEFRGWGPGKYDPRHHIFDGTNIVPLNTPSRPVVLPPVYGLRGVGFETFTGDGPISYWNAYVGVTQMGGHGSFSDPRINVNVQQQPDRVTPKLPALLDYQLSLTAPPPPAGSVDTVAAARGREVFNSTGRCASCHIPSARFTDVLSGPDPRVPLLHSPASIGADPEYASRSATKQYRTTPLRALWQHPPYFHDGRAADLPAVVNFYNGLFGLALTEPQKADLVEYLKSL